MLTMRTLLWSSSGQDQRRLFKSLASWFILTGSAALIGLMVAREQWRFLGLATAAIIAIQWPITAALGIYVFLIPFESILVFGEGKSALTVLGALTAAALPAYLEDLSVGPHARHYGGHCSRCGAWLRGFGRCNLK
jgi:hypothetical protein